MVSYMAENGRSYSPDGKGIITVGNQRYHLRGFIPIGVMIRYLDEGLPMVGGRRVCNAQGKDDVDLEKEGKPGSTLFGRLIDAETSRLSSPTRETILLEKVKRIL